MATAEVKGLADGSEKPPEGEDGSMTLWEHLEELRGRIIRMALAFLVGAGVCWFYKEAILLWLTLPLREGWPTGVGAPELHFGSPAALFISYVRLSALSGFLFALPIILYQLWAFIAPGLYSREKKFAIPFVVSSVLLFVGGGYFGYRVAFPPAFQFLLGFAGQLTAKSQPLGDGSPPITIVPTVMIGDYIEFVTRMFLAFGAAAELPIVAFFLTVAGIITHRHLIKFFRYFIVVAFIISAIVTPPDPLSQVLLAVPLIGLYGLSIGVSWIFTMSRERTQAKEAAAEKANKPPG
jgi:sec-independent protein translocase protein TatC